jgi:hypothetical protein
MSAEPTDRQPVVTGIGLLTAAGDKQSSWQTSRDGGSAVDEQTVLDEEAASRY